MDIFISYSKKDSDSAFKIADRLQSAGFEIWIDRSLEVGDKWEEIIEENLYRAKDVIIILSKNALNSQWVQHEGSMAYALKKNLFPLLIEEIHPSDLPIWAQKIQYRNFSGGVNITAIDDLIRELTPVKQLERLLEKQYSVFLETNVLPNIEFLQAIEPSLQEDPHLNPETASFLFIAALRNDLHADFWVQVALENKVDVLTLLKDHINEKEFRFRTKAIEALTLVIDVEQCDLLFQFLRDPYPQVRKAAIRALWKFPSIRSQVINSLAYECFVPAGEFLMGLDEIPALGEFQNVLSQEEKDGLPEFPAHVVKLTDYFLDKYPVTNADYACFLLDTKPEAIKTDKFITKTQGKDTLSVTNLDWDDAYEYAHWAGKKLPTEAQWEKAARGINGYLFPWGNNFEVNRAHTLEFGKSQLLPVDAFSSQGDSIYGAANLVGNVWEWVYDWYKENYYGRLQNPVNPTGPARGDKKVLRGGSCKESSHHANAYKRIARSPLYRSPFVGLRCAMTIGELNG